MYQTQYLSQDFVHHMNECEENAKVRLKNIESSDIDVYEKLFFLVLNVHT